MATQEKTRGEILLDAIYDEVHQKLNPDGEECWHCGGEGYTYDCIDGCCVDAESGCEDCATPCVECRLRRRDFLKAVREEVIRFDDVDTATAWLKSIGRWRDSITSEQVKEQIAAARAKLDTPAVPSKDVK